MKISIITFHDTFNFGATLQCAALCKYLASQGHEITVLNYMPKYIRNKKSSLKEFYNIGLRHGISSKFKAILKGLFYILYFRNVQKRDKAYSNFIKGNINISKQIFNYEELKSLPNSDFFICGSDQIWNPNLTGGRFDKAFFLDFIKKDKIAYGVSTGEIDLNKYKPELLDLTKDFVRISVRESSTAKTLGSILNREINVVLDCTLLLDDNDYVKMEVDIDNTEPYLLFYNVSSEPIANVTARIISQKLGLQIIDVSPSPFIRIPGAKKIADIGPGEFLGYVRKAKFIVTNSFHGTVFSIIYKKDFYSIPHKTRAGRVVDLLDSLELSDRLIRNVEDIKFDSIDYKRSYACLYKARLSSFEFLNSINCK